MFLDHLHQITKCGKDTLRFVISMFYQLSIETFEYKKQLYFLAYDRSAKHICELIKTFGRGITCVKACRQENQSQGR